MRTVSCAQARQIDLVDYLAWLGFHAFKILGAYYWYFSPFRKENTPSFKVDRSRNVFYDPVTKQGGDILDFGVLYHRLPERDFLQLLVQDYPIRAFSVDTPVDVGSGLSLKAGEKKGSKMSGVVVKDIRPLVQRSLLDYLQHRAIDLDIARRFCREVDMEWYGKKHTVIGFANDQGGYELRNADFQGSSTPKALTFFNNCREVLTVFDDFFSFLAFRTMEQDNPFAITDFLILPSLLFFQRGRRMMEKYQRVDLFLDRSSAGMSCTKQALKSHPHYRDESLFYWEYNDLNDWLIQWRRKTTP